MTTLADIRASGPPLAPTNGHQPKIVHPITLAQWVEPAPVTPEADKKADLKAQLDWDLEKSVRRSGYMRQLFYVVVLLVALAGQVSGAVAALGIPLIWAVPAVAALEVGGIVVLNNADVRRRLGERATGSRILSVLIAAWAVAFNWMAHTNKLLAGFFAGMSALGYLVWVMHTENQRRDRLRATGDLPPTTPAYELVGHWLRHPWLTLRAKNLAKADPRLGLYRSIEAAADAIAKERRTAAIAKVVGKEIRKSSRDDAEIALTVYELDEVASRLKDRADYDGLTDMIAARLDPRRLTAQRSARRGRGRAAAGVGAQGDGGHALPPTPTVGAPAHAHTPTDPAQPMPNVGGEWAAQGGAPMWAETPTPSAAPTTDAAYVGGAQPKPTAQPTVQPNGAAPTRPAPRRTQPKPATPKPTMTPIPGLTALQQQRLADLDREFPGDLAGRDKVMAHMRAHGYDGWSSKEPARTLINLLRAQRESAQGAQPTTPAQEES